MSVWSGAESCIPPQTFFGCGSCNTCKRRAFYEKQCNIQISQQPTRDVFSEISEQPVNVTQTAWAANGIIGPFKASFIVSQRDSNSLYIECAANKWWLVLDTANFIPAVIDGCVPKLSVDMCKRASQLLDVDLERPQPSADALAVYLIVKKYSLRHLQTQQGGLHHYMTQRTENGFRITHAIWPEVCIDITNLNTDNDTKKDIDPDDTLLSYKPIPM